MSMIFCGPIAAGVTRFLILMWVDRAALDDTPRDPRPVKEQVRGQHEIRDAEAPAYCDWDDL
jgi:hypothetical protein